MINTGITLKRIAIAGGGPSGLFMYKRLIEAGRKDFVITVFEASDRLGEGFPYSPAGANKEHITNVSGNEIPEIVIPISEWIKTVPEEVLQPFGINKECFNDYKVLPRLLFGKYLNAQFQLLQRKAIHAGVKAEILFNSTVTDVCDHPVASTISLQVNNGDYLEFDILILCTGHKWPSTHENTVPGYFDSPYPPAKLAGQFNHPVAIRGASLTAIDAIRTLARHHGQLKKTANGKVLYQLNADASNFRIVMHSHNGMLPAVRFHLDDSHLSKDSLLSAGALQTHMTNNEGFLSLDFIFEKDFKEPIKAKEPAFYEVIKDMKLEDFVDLIMGLREQVDAFTLFKAEYVEAEKSIRRKESIYWKEMLAILSFAMNYPAKHLSAEDMLRLRTVLMPLISIVIAFVPQGSCEELIALHDAGLLELLSVSNDSKVVIDAKGKIVYILTDNDGRSIQTSYNTYIDCVGQPHLSLDSFPFRGLLKSGSVSAARLKFRSSGYARELLAKEVQDIERNGDNYFLKVPGLTINDCFQAVDHTGNYNSRLYIMAVPFIGGYNPDYSGLDFCEEASKIIIKSICDGQGFYNEL